MRICTIYIDHYKKKQVLLDSVHSQMQNIYILLILYFRFKEAFVLNLKYLLRFLKFCLNTESIFSERNFSFSDLIKKYHRRLIIILHMVFGQKRNEFYSQIILLCLFCAH